MTTAFGSAVPKARERFDLVRSRVDKTLLRVQGRLDHPNFDRFTPWLIATALFGSLLVLALARNHSVQTGGDLAAWLQGTWLLGEGYKPEATLVSGNLLAEQAALIVYPLSLLLRYLPRTTTLLVIQALALSLTVIPLWRLARGPGRLRVGVTSAVAFAYCVYSGIHFVNLAGFHPAAVALPAIVGAVLYGIEGKRWPFMLCVAMVLVCRADLGLSIAGLGVLLVVEGRRRWGLWTVAVGLGWAVFAIFLIQPALNAGFYPHVDAFASFGDTPFGILWGIVSHPIDFLGEVFSRENFKIVVTLLAPVLFLPLVAPRYLLPAVPLYALYLAADVPIGRLAESSQTVPMTAFIFCATVFALKRSGRVLVERVSVDRRVVIALLLTATVFFVRDSASSPYEEPWNWADRSAADVAILEAVASIPDAAAVRASDRALPLLAERIAVYELELGAPGEDIDAVVDGVDWIVLDPETVPTWDSLDVSVFNGALGLRGFQESFDGWVTNADGEEELTGVRVYQFTGVAVVIPAG